MTTAIGIADTKNWENFRGKLNLALPQTGDLRATFNTSPYQGWIVMDGNSIGDASSGATNRANADTQNLYVLIWNNVSNANAPVAGGRGASALADFNAHKAMTLPALTAPATYTKWMVRL